MADRKDRGLLRAAADPRRRWGVPTELRAGAGPALLRALSLAPEIDDPVKAIAAVCDIVRTGAIIEGQNQTDEWNQNRNDRLDEGKLTENVGIMPAIIEKPISSTG